MAGSFGYTQTIDDDDIDQEYALQLLEGKHRQRWQVKSDMLKSRQWSSVITSIHPDGKIYIIPTSYDAGIIDNLISSEIIKPIYRLLNHQQRLILSLYALNGMTHKEIAIRLGYERSAITKKINEIKMILKRGI